MTDTPDESWWYEDEDGRKIGYMFPEDMCTLMFDLYKTDRWRGKASVRYNISQATLSRYSTGGLPISKPLALLILYDHYIHKGSVGKRPTLDATWLRDWVEEEKPPK